NNLADTWSSLREGKPGIGQMQLLDVSRLRFQNAAEVRGFAPEQHFVPEKLDLLDRFAQFALVAARQAIADSGLKITSGLSGKTAIITGSCVGGQASEDIGYVGLYGKNTNRVHPLTIPRTMANAGASHISMEFGITGPAYTVSTAC